MKTLTFIGDVHGKINEYVQGLGDSPTFQLGDMGAGFVPLPERLDAKHRFIRGNHDDPAVCKAHPNYAGEFGYDAEWRMFFIGGAWSIDSEWRKDIMANGAKTCWWPDEELTPEQLDEAFELYIGTKPDIVASHECPSQITEPLLRARALHTGSYFDAKMACGQSRTSKALQKMLEAHKPKVWIFGHYHIDRVLEVKGTQFICLGELHTGQLVIESPEDLPVGAHAEAPSQDQ